jgi:hypothetical protein
VLALHGPALSSWVLALGFSAELHAVPPFGFFFLGQPVVVAGSGPFDPGGRGSYTLPVPNDPALVGLELFGQALAGLCLSNLLRVVVLQ